MPELDVTEEQLERLETVRTDLESAFLDGYGHMRVYDAVEYLLDTYTPPGERVEERVVESLDSEVRDEDGEIDYPVLQSVARRTDGVKGSGMSAEEMYEAVLEARLLEARADRASVGVARPDRSDRSDRPGSDASDGASAVDGTNDASDEVNESDGSEGAGDSDPAGNGTNDATDATPSAGGGGSQLQQMMSLLETHDDKWRKAASGDAPYEVDLPDGGTESARTKDDVKRILFTNY
jgi:hypothetical protein